MPGTFEGREDGDLMQRVLRLVTVAGAAGALALAGCGSKDSNTGGGSSTPAAGSGSASGPAPATASVKIADFKYAPPEVTVKSGGKVTFANTDSAEHTATAEDGSSFDSGTLTTGKSKAVTFAKPGIYKYTCSFHAFMHGQITVK